MLHMNFAKIFSHELHQSPFAMSIKTFIFIRDSGWRLFIDICERYYGNIHSYKTGWSIPCGNDLKAERELAHMM